MRPELGLHERYLVVRAKNGWSVNLGADMLNVYSDRQQAREAAARHCADATAAGRSADWVDTSEDQVGGVA